MCRTKILIESNIVRSYRNIRLQKLWALSIRKWETLLPGIWRRLRYPMPLFPQYSPTRAPATVPKLQKAKAGTRRMKDHMLEEKIRFKTKEHEDAQVYVT